MKKRYLMIACLLFSLVFINVEASERGSSSVGIEFYKRYPRKKSPHRKQTRQVLRGKYRDRRELIKRCGGGGQGTLPLATNNYRVQEVRVRPILAFSAWS